MENLRLQFDKDNLHEVIENLPKQFSEAFQDIDNKISPETEKIVFCGMGGSALPANLLKTFLYFYTDNFNIPIKINRDYTLPKIVNEKWSGFFDSYSGNTEETLTCLKEAETKNLKEKIILAHGGKLEEAAQENGYNFIKLPDTKQPRMAYGYVVGALLKTFANSGLLNLNFNELNKDIEESLALSNEIESQAQDLAKKLKGKIPIVYSNNVWKYIAMVWKINFNENSKTQSFWNIIPEMNHNEMVGFTNLLADFQIIILKDPNDHPRNIKRMETLQQVLQNKVPVEIIDMKSGSDFKKMITSLHLGLLTSYYLALINEINPAPVEMVENFKKLL